MSRWGRFVGGVALALLGGLAVLGAPASAGTDQELTIESIDVSGFPEVLLTVSPPPGLAGQDVKPESFALKENGADREVKVTRLSSDKLDVVVVMDTSGSMRGGPIISAKASALSFVNGLPADTNIALVGFGDVPTVISPFTTDRAVVAAAIDSLAASGETSLYDAMVTASDLLATAGGNQRSIVLLSDGGDTASKTPFDQALAALAKTGAGFTAIELTTDESDRPALDRLAAATEGRVVAVEDPNALDATYAAIASRLSNLYELRFFSSGATRADLTISVDQGGVRASVLKAVEFPDRPLTTTATTEPEIVAARPFVEKGGGPAGSGLLIAGATLVGLGLLVGLVVALVGNEPQRRLAREYEQAGVDQTTLTWLTSLTKRATSLSSGFLEQRGQVLVIDRSLDAAGLSLRAGELVVVVAASCLAVGMLGFLLFGAIGLVVGFVLPLLLTPVVLRSLRSRRQLKFGDQLGEALLLLAGNLRAGFGLVQAIDSVARESDAPMGEELGRVITETRLGGSLDQALADAAERVGSEDFRWVVEAMEIHREIGGDLAELLDRVADTIRARARAHRQVRALSAEGRASAVVLTVLPLGVGAVLATTNRDYVGELFDTTTGQLMVAAAGALLVIGALWLRRIVRPEF